jgi:DNA (cytosine-5)-methyltransferase 1
VSSSAAIVKLHRRLDRESPVAKEVGKLRDSDFMVEDLAAITHYLHASKPWLKQHYRKILKNRNCFEVIDWFEQSDFGMRVLFPPSKSPVFTFVDLFAGIGGMRLGMQGAGGQCIFSSEWDDSARMTYFANFGEIPFGDITKIANGRRFSSEIPKHDVLVGGFPCQAFSIAGFKGGFADTRGTLFFNLARVLQDHRPRAFLFENVKGLVSHNRRHTFSRILDVLENDPNLRYHVKFKIVNAKDFEVPQNRERIFIVGFRNKKDYDRFEFPQGRETGKRICNILENSVVDAKYYLSKQYYDTLVKHRARHAAKGNGFGFEIKGHDQIANAIVVGGMGRERNLVIDKRRKTFRPDTNINGPVNSLGIRRMTPREWARLQGFGEAFQIPVSDAQAYKQLGNSVAVPAIEATANAIVAALGL